MFSTYVPISANCLFVYCLLHLYIRMFIVFLCNINHCNDSAPCWDLDWTIKSYLILSVHWSLVHAGLYCNLNSLVLFGFDKCPTNFTKYFEQYLAYLIDRNCLQIKI